MKRSHSNAFNTSASAVDHVIHVVCAFEDEGSGPNYLLKTLKLFSNEADAKEYAKSIKLEYEDSEIEIVAQIAAINSAFPLMDKLVLVIGVFEDDDSTFIEISEMRIFNDWMVAVKSAESEEFESNDIHFCLVAHISADGKVDMETSEEVIPLYNNSDDETMSLPSDDSNFIDHDDDAEADDDAPVHADTDAEEPADVVAGDQVADANANADAEVEVPADVVAVDQFADADAEVEAPADVAAEEQVADAPVRVRLRARLPAPPAGVEIIDVDAD